MRTKMLSNLTQNLYAARDRYHSLAEKENSDKLRLMGDRANALANKNKMSRIGDQNMKQLADKHYKMLTRKQYPNRSY